MRRGDYVQHRKTKRRGELLDLLPDGDWIVYSAATHRSLSDQLWFAQESELSRLLTAAQCRE